MIGCFLSVFCPLFLPLCFSDSSLGSSQPGLPGPYPCPVARSFGAAVLFFHVLPPLPCLAPTPFYFPPGSVGFPWFLLAVAQAWRDTSGTATLLLPHWLGSEQVHPGRGRCGAGCHPPRGQFKESMSGWVPGAPCPTPSPLLTHPHLLPNAPGSHSSSQNMDYRKETSLRFQACPQELCGDPPFRGEERPSLGT